MKAGARLQKNAEKMALRSELIVVEADCLEKNREHSVSFWEIQKVYHLADADFCGIS